MLEVSIRGGDGHQFQEWDNVARDCWAVLDAEIHTEEYPGPHTRYHILGSALSESMRLGYLVLT